MRIRQQILSILVFFSLTLFAVDNNHVDVISASDGLPNSKVNRVFIGHKGLLWVGTSNGLCYYDGYRFSVKQSIPFDSTSLADDNIKAIAQNSRLEIWLLTNYGVENIDLNTGEVRKVKHIGQVSDVVGLVASMNMPDVYLAYANTVIKIDGESYQSDTVYHDNALEIYGITAIEKDLAILGRKELVLLKTDRGDVVKHRLGQGIEITQKQSVVQWSDTSVIFSNNERLILFDFLSGKSKELFRAEAPIESISDRVDDLIVFVTESSAFQLKLTEGKFNKPKRLSETDFVGCHHVVLDNNHLVWCASDKGVVKINPHSRNFQRNTYFNRQNIIYEASKSGIVYKDRRQRMVFANTKTGQSIFLPLRSCNAFRLIENEYYLAGNDDGLYRIGKDGKSLNLIEGFKNISIYSINEQDGVIWLSTSTGVFKKNESEFFKVCENVISEFIVFDHKIYCTSETGFGVLDLNTCTHKLLLEKSNKKGYLRIIEMLQSLDGKIWLATVDGLYLFNPNGDENKGRLFERKYAGNVFSLIEANQLPEIWFSTDLGIGAINYQNQQVMLFGVEDGVGVTSFIEHGALHGKDGRLSFFAQQEFVTLHPDSVFRNSNIPNVEVSKMSIVSDKRTERKLLPLTDTILMLPVNRFLELSFTTFDYFAPRRTVFEFSLTGKGHEGGWEKLQDNTLSVGGLATGDYKLKIRARNSHGVISSKIKEIIIIVKTPIYLSKIAFLLYSLFLGVVVISLIHFRTRNLRKVNKEYREKERIAKKIEQQKEELTLKNKNITDSINYARRIQLAMMPSVKLFKTIFPDSFILHMPKDIVSGDFYWVNKVKGNVFFSAVDCTGHGVPGAFMSIIGVELFRRITEVEKIYTPAEVLNSLSKNFERVFGDVDEMKLRDGMDLAFCLLNEEHTFLEYAGAFNPLYIVRDNSIIEIKGDRHSVGVYEEDDELRSFNNHVVPLQDGDIIYIFTDGYVDQFGGPEGKKYKYRRFRHLLLALHQMSMDKQEEFLRKSILEWKGDQEQVDDILVMGLRIKHTKNK